MASIRDGDLVSTGSDRLLAALPTHWHTPERLRLLRAVEALEYNGSPAARDVLAKLAAGADGDRLTLEARDALARPARPRAGADGLAQETRQMPPVVLDHDL